MTIQLKPCPFCGGEAEPTEDYMGDDKFGNPVCVQWAVMCKSCFVKSPPIYQADAIMAACAWNSRKEDNQ